MPKDLGIRRLRLELLGLQSEGQAATKDPVERTLPGTAQKEGVVCRVIALEAHRSRSWILSAVGEELGLPKRNRCPNVSQQHRVQCKCFKKFLPFA